MFGFAHGGQEIIWMYNLRVKKCDINFLFEADIKEGKLSLASPMARALIGKYAGDIAQVQAPGGIREFEIIDVRYQ